MKRCPHFVIRNRRLACRLSGFFIGFLALGALGFVSPVQLQAQAQVVESVRQFPPNVRRGTLVVVQPPIITLNGRPARLSPGARIRGTNGLLHMSGTLLNQSLLVNYLLEPGGMVHEVWILTPAEAAQPVQSAPYAQ